MNLFEIFARIGIDDKDFNSGLNKAKASGEQATKSIKSQVASLAAEYRKSGMEQSEAMRKAWEEIERTSQKSSEKVKGHISSIGKGFENVGNALSKIGSFAVQGAKVAVGAITTVGAGLATITTMAVKGFAEYEQLVGGVDTLFKNSSQLVQSYAENAYKTAGMSANEYMEIVTGFSASLLQSLGGDTEKAAKAADIALTDMSDNANKMGLIFSF